MHSSSQAHEYTELKALLAQQGLFDSQPGYYTGKVLQSGLFLVLAVISLIMADRFWIQILNAALLAFVSTQIAFLGHDAAHRQMFQSARKTDAFGLLCTLLTAISYSWWTDKHNQHHRHPNHLDLDPDVKLRFLAFTAEQTRITPGFRRCIMKHQARLFFPMLLLQGFATRFHSIRFLLSKRARSHLIELLFMIVHFFAYVGCVLFILGLGQGIIFILVHQMLFGLYMGVVFAPNHKGMLMLKGADRLDRFRQQVLTSRNVRAHPVTDFCFGGLNYQIEHHLFPYMPRNRLKMAQRTVKEFCQARAIPYRETSLFHAYGDTLRYLHQTCAPLREADR